MIYNSMSPNQIAMLVGGAILFVAALVCLFKRFPAALVIVLFVVAIVMIGFPSIKTFKVPGAEVDLKDSLAAVEKNPNDVAARDKLAAQAAQLSKQPNLTPEARVTLSKAQLALGQRSEAAANLQTALKEKPNLKVDPKLRAMVEASPH